MISATELDQELKNDAPFIILTAREVIKTPDSTIPPEVTPVIEEFSDVFPKNLPNKFYHRCVNNAIDLVPGSSLSNLAHY